MVIAAGPVPRYRAAMRATSLSRTTAGLLSGALLVLVLGSELFDWYVN